MQLFRQLSAPVLFRDVIWLFGSHQLTVTMTGNETLHILCPAQKTVRGIVMPCIGSLILGGAIASRGFEPSLLLAVVSIGFAGFLALLYRNLFYRDELCILREGAVHANAKFCVRTSEIVALRRLPAPGAMSADAKLASIGLAHGLIEIETKTDTYRFGAGLDDYAIDATIDRIERFCDLDRKPVQNAA